MNAHVLSKLAVQTEVQSAHMWAYSGKMHRYVSPERLQPVIDRLADGAYQTLAQPPRGAQKLAALLRPATWCLDAVVGTGMHHNPIGETMAARAQGGYGPRPDMPHAERLVYLRETYHSYRAHPTDLGVLGLVGTAALLPCLVAGMALGVCVGVGHALLYKAWHGGIRPKTDVDLTWGHIVWGQTAEVASTTTLFAGWIFNVAMASLRGASAMVKCGIVGLGAAAGYLFALAQLVAGEIRVCVGSAPRA